MVPRRKNSAFHNRAGCFDNKQQKRRRRMNKSTVLTSRLTLMALAIIAGILAAALSILLLNEDSVFAEELANNSSQVSAEVVVSQIDIGRIDVMNILYNDSSQPIKFQAWAKADGVQLGRSISAIIQVASPGTKYLLIQDGAYCRETRQGIYSCGYPWVGEIQKGDMVVLHQTIELAPDVSFQDLISLEARFSDGYAINYFAPVTVSTTNSRFKFGSPTTTTISGSPKITSLSPLSVKPGDWVTIKGSRFLSASGTDVSSLQVWLVHDNGGVNTLATVVDEKGIAKPYVGWHEDSIQFMITDDKVPQSGYIYVIVNKGFAKYEVRFTIEPKNGPAQRVNAI